MSKLFWLFWLFDDELLIVIRVVVDILFPVTDTFVVLSLLTDDRLVLLFNVEDEYSWYSEDVEEETWLL